MRLVGTRVVLLMYLFVCLSLISTAKLTLASSFPNDSYVHYGKDGSTCSEHMDNNQAPPANNQMVVCKLNSGATTWWGEVYKSDGTYICSFSATAVTDTKKTFPCPITTKGYYRGYVHWLVGGSPQMNSTDQWFKK